MRIAGVWYVDVCVMLLLLYDELLVFDEVRGSSDERVAVLATVDRSDTALDSVDTLRGMFYGTTLHLFGVATMLTVTV